MRRIALLWVVVASAAGVGCSASRRGAQPCGPLCITEVRRAPVCCEVTLPERTESRLAYRAIPAECRHREMPVYGVCERTTYEDRCTPVTELDEVPDLCPVLVPTYERVCVPTFEYGTVTDYEDRVEPICEPRYTPLTRTRRVPVCGCVCDECGNADREVVGWRCEECPAGRSCRMEKVGERLVQAPVGEHLEPVQTSQTRVCVPTGSRMAVVVTGHHLEPRVVDVKHERVVADRRAEVRQTGTRREAVVKRPCRLEAQEEVVRIPRMKVWVCDDSRHSHRGPVISSEEYTAITGKPPP
jgi:hypothetical protein